jgi:hypothetical protein
VPEEDFHLSNQTRFQAHKAHASLEKAVGVATKTGFSQK